MTPSELASFVAQAAVLIGFDDGNEDIRADGQTALAARAATREVGRASDTKEYSVVRSERVRQRHFFDRPIRAVATGH